MTELGKIKPLVQPLPVRPINKDPAKKEQEKKKKNTELPHHEDDSSNEHVDEFI